MPKLPALPAATRPVLWGIAGGALAMVIVGFSWGGWITGGKAETSARLRVDDAVVAALAPVCVERFQRSGDASARLQELKSAASWKQGSYVENGGWAKLPGTHTPERVTAVAQACANLLAG